MLGSCVLQPQSVECAHQLTNVNTDTIRIPHAEDLNLSAFGINAHRLLGMKQTNQLKSQ